MIIMKSLKMIEITIMMLIFQGMIMYEVNGNFPADDFFRINATTGQICVNKDLKLDTNAREQYEVYTSHV